MSARTYRLLNLLLLGALFAGSMMVYPSLPARFPRHFDASGRPDAWQERSVLSWLMLPLIAAGTATLLEMAARWSTANPSLWNVPDKPRFLALTPAEQAPIVALLRDFIGFVGVMTTTLMMIVQATVYIAARTPGNGMPAYLFAAIGIIIMVILAGALRMNARVGPMIRDAHRRRTATP